MKHLFTHPLTPQGLHCGGEHLDGAKGHPRGVSPGAATGLSPGAATGVSPVYAVQIRPGGAELRGLTCVRFLSSTE